MAAPACEDPAARALVCLGGLALRVRRPARKLCGSLRVAVVYASALLGAYLVIETSVCLPRFWGPDIDRLLSVSGAVAILGALGDIAVLTAIIGWGRFATRGAVTRLLCGRLALAVAHAPLAPAWIAWFVAKCVQKKSAAPFELAMWEAGRLAGTLVLAALLFCLLDELHPVQVQATAPWASTPEPVAFVPTAARVAASEEPEPGPAPPPRRPHSYS